MDDSLLDELAALAADAIDDEGDEAQTDAPADTAAMFENFKDYIANEVLAVKFASGAGSVELDVNGVNVAVTITKAGN